MRKKKRFIVNCQNCAYAVVLSDKFVSCTNQAACPKIAKTFNGAGGVFPLMFDPAIVVKCRHFEETEEILVLG